MSYKYDIPTEKDYAIQEKELRVSDTQSVLSDTSTIAQAVEVDTSGFKTSTTLNISARGIPVLRFPLPTNELEIPIYSQTGELLYVSQRAKRCSNSCVLRHEKLGDLLSTTYFCGPNREPIIQYLQGAHAVSEGDGEGECEGRGQVHVKGKWTSRSTAFANVDGRSYEWSYANTKDAQGKRVNIIVLREKFDSKRRGETHGRVLARLVRNEETRTPGTRPSYAGNGGRLDIDETAVAGSLDEALIVATCIMMLKKEVDRRRLMQTMVIMGAASGGGGGGS